MECSGFRKNLNFKRDTQGQHSHVLEEAATLVLRAPFCV